MRKQIAAANWKMNLNYKQALMLADGVLHHVQALQAHQEVVFGVPFPYLSSIVERSSNKAQVYVAAQNCSEHVSGAYTGETSVDMLKSVGVKYVIIGHSERREYFHETNEQIANKINLILKNDLIPLFCCGEPLDVRASNRQNEYVASQLEASLFHLDRNHICKVVIAYEPIWAIGTGKTATADQAEEMHAFIRTHIANKYGQDTANHISILYGGSVKGNNAKEIFSQPNVDGGLVGGASLNAEEFIQIIEALK